MNIKCSFVIYDNDYELFICNLQHRPLSHLAAPNAVIKCCQFNCVYARDILTIGFSLLPNHLPSKALHLARYNKYELMRLHRGNLNIIIVQIYKAQKQRVAS